MSAIQTPSRKNPARHEAGEWGLSWQPSGKSKHSGGSSQKRALAVRAAKLLDTEISFIANEQFIGLRDTASDRSDFAMQVEIGQMSVDQPASAGLPSHLGRMCATPLLTPEQESELFRRMNFCKYRANALRSRLSRSRPDAAKVAEAEDYLLRAERVRNYLISANTRLVMSIARKFADNRNSFDDLLSQGIASLMHAVEKFDFSRGYRFSTYSTCAVRRDLYRLVMGRKKDLQRYATGTSEVLDSRPAEAPEEGELTESAWDHLQSSIKTMLQQLDDRERFIVTHRFGLEKDGKKASYSYLGKQMGISKERVRQLANRALDKLRMAADAHHLEALLA